jgi:ESS family glutamate:Na+ symporter
MLELDLIQTLALGGAVLFVGYGLCRGIPVLGRYNLPAPVVGGLLVALVSLAAHTQGVRLLRFDTTLQSPLMIAFFTTIGFGASLSLLRVGGPQVFLFFGVATVFAILQNVVGAGLAALFGLHPLFGVLTGSVTLTGGPATGLAFAPLFEQAGVTGAASVAVATAMAGIVAGGVVGGPLGTLLIKHLGLAGPRASASTSGRGEQAVVTMVRQADGERDDASVSPAGEDPETYAVLKNVVAILVAMGLGAWVSKGFVALGVTLPAYIGAMLVAAAIRNVDDRTGWIRLSHRIIDDVGAVALSLFLVVALMSLELWKLSGLAVPLLVMLVVQVTLVVLVCLWPLFQLMGRDYEAAVMSGGFIGFMLGTTANAMAVMRTLVERHGPAPRAFLVAPMVGAFFIDFTNALIITACLNIFR